MKNFTRWFLGLACLVALMPALVQAQAGLPESGALASQNLRGYTHMFIAYFIAWGLILGWVVSIARRLGKVEEALDASSLPTGGTNE